MDKEEWIQVVSDSLGDVREMSCLSVPMEEFIPLERITLGRYIRFTMKDYHGSTGGALRYFNVHHRNHDICKLK